MRLAAQANRVNAPKPRAVASLRYFSPCLAVIWESATFY
jgi:hypothetical protein